MDDARDKVCARIGHGFARSVGDKLGGFMVDGLSSSRCSSTSPSRNAYFTSPLRVWHPLDAAGFRKNDKIFVMQLEMKVGLPSRWSVKSCTTNLALSCPPSLNLTTHRIFIIADGEISWRTANLIYKLIPVSSSIASSQFCSAVESTRLPLRVLACQSR